MKNCPVQHGHETTIITSYLHGITSQNCSLTSAKLSHIATFSLSYYPIMNNDLNHNRPAKPSLHLVPKVSKARLPKDRRFLALQKDYRNLYAKKKEIEQKLTEKIQECFKWKSAYEVAKTDLEDYVVADQTTQNGKTRDELKCEPDNEQKSESVTVNKSEIESCESDNMNDRNNNNTAGVLITGLTQRSDDLVQSLSQAAFIQNADEWDKQGDLDYNPNEDDMDVDQE